MAVLVDARGELEPLVGALEGAVGGGHGLPGFPDLPQDRREPVDTVVQPVFPEVDEEPAGLPPDGQGRAPVDDDFEEDFLGHQREDHTGDQGKDPPVHVFDSVDLAGRVEQHGEEVDLGHQVALAQSGLGRDVEGDLRLVLLAEALDQSLRAARVARQPVGSDDGRIEGDRTGQSLERLFQGPDALDLVTFSTCFENSEQVFEGAGFFGLEQDDLLHERTPCPDVRIVHRASTVPGERTKVLVPARYLNLNLN